MTLIRAKARPEEDGYPAGFITRLIAIAIDLAVLTVIITTVTVLGQFIGQSLHVGVWTMRLITLGTAAFAITLYVLYFVGFTTLGGQTPGQRIMGVRVLRPDGSRVHLKRSVIRYIGMWLSLPLLWGYLIVLVDNRRRAFQDKLADTLVVYYSIPAGELGPFEQYLQTARIRRAAKVAAQKALLAASMPGAGPTAETAEPAPSEVATVTPALSTRPPSD